MSIRDLLAGVKPRTKSVKLTDEKSVVLHELSTNARMQIEEDRVALSKQEGATVHDFNKFAARVISMSLLGEKEPVTDDDIEAIFELMGLQLVDEVYNQVIDFNKIPENPNDDTIQEEARKN